MGWGGGCVDADLLHVGPPVLGCQCQLILNGLPLTQILEHQQQQQQWACGVGEGEGPALRQFLTAFVPTFCRASNNLLDLQVRVRVRVRVLCVWWGGMRA